MTSPRRLRVWTPLDEKEWVTESPCTSLQVFHEVNWHRPSRGNTPPVKIQVNTQTGCQTSQSWSTETVHQNKHACKESMIQTVQTFALFLQSRINRRLNHWVQCLSSSTWWRPILISRKSSASPPEATEQRVTFICLELKKVLSGSQKCFDLLSLHVEPRVVMSC